MTNKEKIQKALENWNDKNCIIEFCLHVWDKQKRGYDFYTLEPLELDSIKEKMNLKGVKFEWRNTSIFYNQAYIEKKIRGIENDIKSLRRQIKEYKKEIEPYKNALERC